MSVLQSVHDLIDFLKGLLLFNVIMRYENLIAQCYCKLLWFLGYYFNSPVLLGVEWVLTHFPKEPLVSFIFQLM